MGQKVGGYRRNVPYGRETVGIETSKAKAPTWRFQVNPSGKLGWNRGNSGRKEKEYGESLGEARRLRTEVEEVRKVFGCESNGLGRKGTKETGYTRVGEYTYGETRKEGRGEWARGSGEIPHAANAANAANAAPHSTGEKPISSIRVQKKAKKVYDEGKRKVARERIRRKQERRRQTKINRQRTDLKQRRKDKELRGEKKERLSVLGRSTKRRKPVERAEAVARSGRMPTGERRTKLIARELERGLNHVEVRRQVENVRKHHAKSSSHGRKSPRGQGGSDRERTPDGRRSGGYYGYQLVIKGPLGGARRTMIKVIQQGTVPRGTKQARRTTSFEHAKTKIGTIGVKVTYCYGRG